MERYLMRLESPIFGSRELKENIARSAEIRFVTSPEFFEAVCPQTYSSENPVYSGGGHTVLQFDTQEGAEAFSRELTLRVLRDFPKMELFVKIQQYDSAKPPAITRTGWLPPWRRKRPAGLPPSTGRPLAWSIPNGPRNPARRITIFPSFGFGFRRAGP